jgi:hypothetical protein
MCDQWEREKGKLGEKKEEGNRNIFYIDSDKFSIFSTSDEG